THRRRHGSSPVNGTERGTSAEMGGHDAQTFGGTPEKLCRPTSSPGMAEPVEPVTPQPELLVPPTRERVRPCCDRERGVERRVEARDGRDAGKDVAYRVDPGQCTRLVEGRQGREIGEGGDDVGV